MLMELISSAGLILPGYWIIRLIKVKVQSNIERLSLSYLLSLAVMFTLLYLGGILKAFNIASFIFLAIVVISFTHLFVLSLTKAFSTLRLFKTSVYRNISTEKLMIAILIIGLLSIYTVFLSSRAILDSDVVQYYLPIAREIVRENGFTYCSGYDYNILLKPIGISVLYAWTYVVSDSTLSEAFRLMPLIPVLILILLNYAIASSVTKLKSIGTLSTTLFLILPLHDRLLLFNAFYPDTFYYPLVFAAIYFLLEYSKSKHSGLLLWSGTGLGVAGLLKAQTIYVFIAFTLVLLVLELRAYKKLLVVLCCLTPFYLLIPRILSTLSIQREGFHFLIPSFSGTQWILFLFLSILSGMCCYITIRNNSSGVSARILNFSITKNLVKKISLFLIPFSIFSSLWYLNNLLEFGTLIWTSSINLPNYDWALEVLQSLETVSRTVDVWHYLIYFVFAFMDPAVMGYVMLIPFLIGSFFLLRNVLKIEGFGVLFIFSIILTNVILSNVVISLNPTSGYNPRDIFVLGPFLTTTTAVGICFIASALNKAGDNVKNVLPFFIVAYLGLLSYIHSVLVYFTNIFCVTMLGDFTTSLGRAVVLSLKQTSFQLAYKDRAIFVGNNILRIILLSLIAGIPLIVYQCYKIFVKKRLRVVVHFRSQKVIGLIKNGLRDFVILLILSAIIFPRVEMLLAQGGIRGIREFQLKNTYLAFYELIVNGGREFEGGILTFKAADGLPYYLREIKVIDLKYPANLAFLKDCLLSHSSYEAVTKLKQQDIRYILVNPSIMQKLDASLNFTFSKMFKNPEYAILSKNLGVWKLFKLGPYEVEKVLVPLSSWSVYLKYTNASYNLNSTESEIFLKLEATNINSRVTIRCLNVPKLNLSDYDYVVVDARGSFNAKVLIRFFLDNGKSFDFSYWKDIYTLTSTPFDLRPYVGRTLRGDMYIGLKSSDEMPSSINISEISFVKVKD